MQPPLALTNEFGNDAAKMRQWQAFLNKNRLVAASLADTLALLNDLLWPPTQVAAAGSATNVQMSSGQSSWR